MIATEQSILDAFNRPVRSIIAKVELYESSTLVNTYAYDDDLISLTVERTGEGKFFGFGICQKLNVKLLDLNRQKNITTDNSFKVCFGDTSYSCLLPEFHVTEVNRDENTNELSITAYDLLDDAATHTVSELEFDTVEVLAEGEEVEEGENVESYVSYTINDFVLSCAALLGIQNIVIEGVDDESFSTFYETGANYEGTESIREALNHVAEATQTIYFMNEANELVFKRLDRDGSAVFTIDKNDYISLDSKTSRRLATIYNVTELGNDAYATITETGSTQYVRDNPFWDVRDDIATLVDNALLAVGGLTINQFECDWRGNPYVEIGDKIALVTKDDKTVDSFFLDDVISYDGAYSQKTSWKYEDNEAETSENPTSLGEMIKKTYAKVDKVNKQIDLVASENEANSEQIASIQINTDSISQSVQSYQETVDGMLDEFGEVLDSLTTRVNQTITSEDLQIEIESALSNGVTKVETSTGFTFNEEGLTVGKSESPMTTQITENGMTVSYENERRLVCNDEGVFARNLHAETYLIIGVNSRFEDYAENKRTGCFWIGEGSND